MQAWMRERREVVIRHERIYWTRLFWVCAVCLECESVYEFYPEEDFSCGLHGDVHMVSCRNPNVTWSEYGIARVRSRR